MSLLYLKLPITFTQAYMQYVQQQYSAKLVDDPENVGTHYGNFTMPPYWETR